MKFSGKLGYVQTTEVEPGIFKEVAKERKARGDFIRLLNRVDEGDKINKDFTLSNSVSIVADTYAQENFMWLRYVIYKGVAWEVNSVNVLVPRLNIEMGGLWNGPVEGQTS